MEIALYARVSTHRQQQTQTIEQQLERLLNEVEQQEDWHLAEGHLYRDDGYSGAQLNRPGLDRLRDHAALAGFALVLITAPDRLARKYVHQVLLIDELERYLYRRSSTGRHGKQLRRCVLPTALCAAMQVGISIF